VTDAGAVFSFGFEQYGKLGHGSLESEVLPRRIQALADTGRRFVAVAAGCYHALALTEKGHVYGWGDGLDNGHGQEQHTPQQVAALLGEPVKLVYAYGFYSCAVTETGELYIWGRGSSFHLGHGVAAPQMTPKRVEALSRVNVAAAAIGTGHTFVADEDGMVWAFGKRAALGLSEADAPPRDSEGEDSKDEGCVVRPTLIPNLRVRTLP